MSSSSLLHVCSEEEVDQEANETKKPPKKENMNCGLLMRILLMKDIACLKKV